MSLASFDIDLRRLVDKIVQVCRLESGQVGRNNGRYKSRTDCEIDESVSFISVTRTVETHSSSAQRS